MSLAGLQGRVMLGDRVLVEALDLRLDRGWTCLLGASGAGKSTLLRLLAGLPTAARLEGTRHAPALIGWMAQSDLLQPRLSVLGNLRLMARLRGESLPPVRAKALLAAVGLAGRGAAYPADLSGGERQRLALARTLAEDAPLVALDEPFSALDVPTRAMMHDLAHARLAGRAVVMVTHDPQEALRLGDRILLVRAGRLEELPALAGPHPVDLGDPALARAAAALVGQMRGAVA
ncbi:putative hydroxymethylpyrimidine transport system ATP-binding protein [Rhodobacter sp. JA431]|uniref:ATP-binding cassette domain-containing protein n=1 Tax=Rhodobacter sp. JA431 TaxID=570013 RepID=UPI000BDDBCB8|nr:ATP-binding cassette domain-containing protein [Rhodobacter sp. JA431]SOB99772.1 putative hydroxymethylpyrimidine transport system ATP-binding protein [Rhodobacter sp. JA431]